MYTVGFKFKMMASILRQKGKFSVFAKVGIQSNVRRWYISP